MALKRMDNVAIVVEELGGTIEFFRELGLELEGRGLVDELTFLVYPVVLGTGQRFFETSPHVTLKLIETRDMDKGVILTRYSVEGA